MSNEVVCLTNDNFDKEVLKANQLVLVDFWAEWCNPCKMFDPILYEIADEYQGKIIIAKLNIDLNTNLASRYGIRSIPTLLLFKKGKVIATKVGTLSKSQLKEFLGVSLIT